MEQSVLITGKQSPFTDDLVQEALRRVGRVFASFDDTDEAPEVPDTFGESLRYIPWKRRSMISSRSLMLALEQNGADATSGGGAPTRAIVVCAPEGVNTSLHDTESSTIESTIDAAIKGYLFVIRELAATFIRRGSGDLTIVWYDPGVEILPPVDAAIAGAVDELVRSMLTYYDGEAFSVRGLYASDADGRNVAQWVMEQIVDKGDKSAGRRQRFGQKMGLLPFRR